MSYTPTEWESTDVVTATRMNALEQAVGDMNMSYTPNTWSDGDILSAEKMNALEQAVASGGGGGSSDLSTATVTVNYDFQGQEEFEFIDLDGSAWNDENQEMTAIFKIGDKWNTMGNYEVLSPTGSYEREVLFLYENNKHCTMYSSNPLTFSATGSATVVEIDGLQLVDITGDCTITIS